MFFSTLKNMVRRMVEAGRTVEEITGMLGGPQAGDVKRWAEDAVKAQKAATARQEAAR